MLPNAKAVKWIFFFKKLLKHLGITDVNYYRHKKYPMTVVLNRIDEESQIQI